MPKERRGDRAKDGYRMLVEVERHLARGMSIAEAHQAVAREAWRWAVERGRAVDDPATRDAFTNAALWWLQNERKRPDDWARSAKEDARHVELAPDAAHARMDLTDEDDTYELTYSTLDRKMLTDIAAETGTSEATVLAVLAAFRDRQAK